MMNWSSAERGAKSRPGEAAATAGLRVEPVWIEGARHPDHYRPTGEPDADYESYKELL